MDVTKLCSSIGISLWAVQRIGRQKSFLDKRQSYEINPRSRGA